MKKKPTISDIARIAGVSETTVSNVVNNKKGRVSEETIKKVTSAINSLNYRANYAAKSLRERKSGLIGIVIPQTENSNMIKLENLFYTEIISRVEFLFRQAGYHIILSGLNKDNSDVDFFSKWDVEAAIIIGTYKEKFYENIKKNDVPIVVVDSYTEDDSFYVINTDDDKGGYLAGEYLLGKGHTKIAFVSGQLRENGVMYKRYTGFLRALGEKGIYPTVYEGNVTFEWGQQVGAMIEKEKYTAIFSAADIMSLGLLKSLAGRGIRVPEDISVISYDNTTLAVFANPSLTAVDQYISMKADRIFETVMKLIKGEKAEKQYWMQVGITERDSVTEM